MKKILFLLSFTYIMLSDGQDLVFSNYFGSNIYTNPALTGAAVDNKGQDQALRISTQFRTQAGVGSNYSFNSSFLGIDKKISNSFGAIGGYAIIDRMSQDGSFANNIYNLTYAYGFPIIKNKMNFRFGIGLGSRTQGVDIGRLRFEDQIDYRYGVVHNTDEIFVSNKVTKFDANAGLVLHNKYWYLMAALHNINNANFQFIGQGQNQINRRYSIGVGSNLYIKDYQYGSVLKFLPSIIFVKQGPFTQLNSGMAFSYGGFITSINYRRSMMNFKNSDAIIYSMGIMKDGLRINYSYEHTISSLKFYSPTTHEIGLQMGLHTSKSKNSSFNPIDMPIH